MAARESIGSPRDTHPMESPGRRLRDWLDALTGIEGSGGSPWPPLDIGEGLRAFYLVAAVPGVGADTLEIEVGGSRVTLRGQETPPPVPDDVEWIKSERPAGAFERTVLLPAPVSADACQASFQDGILVLELPKLRATQARRVPVRAETASPLAERPRQVRAGDLVDEQSDQSFPASDPPSWTPERT